MSLFSLCVKTSIGCKVVVEFMCQKEGKISISGLPSSIGKSLYSIIVMIVCSFLPNSYQTYLSANLHLSGSYQEYNKSTTEESTTELSMIFNIVVDFVFAQHHSLLSNLNVLWLAPENLMEMARAVHQKGAALENIWGFVENTHNVRGSVARETRKAQIRINYSGLILSLTPSTLARSVSVELRKIHFHIESIFIVGYIFVVL